MRLYNLDNSLVLVKLVLEKAGNGEALYTIDGEINNITCQIGETWGSSYKREPAEIQPR